MAFMIQYELNGAIAKTTISIIKYNRHFHAIKIRHRLEIACLILLTFGVKTQSNENWNSPLRLWRL